MRGQVVAPCRTMAKHRRIPALLRPMWRSKVRPVVTIENESLLRCTWGSPAHAVIGLVLVPAAVTCGLEFVDKLQGASRRAQYGDVIVPLLLRTR